MRRPIYNPGARPADLLEAGRRDAITQRQQPCDGCGALVNLDGPGWVVTADSKLWHHMPGRSCLTASLERQKRLATEKAEAASGAF